MEQPIVSIITPCYNGENFMDRYFESILAQTYSNIELIFINDGSTDNTEKIAFAYSTKLKQRGIRYIYKYQENAGQAAALNQGLKLFTGKYLTWPDSDDVMKPDCIEKKVEFLEKNQEFALCICKTEIVEEGKLGKRIGIYERIQPTGKDCFFEDMLFLKNVYFAPGGYLLRTKELLKVLPDREIYTGRGGQNAQLLLPMLYHYRCGYIPEILYSYVVRKNSHSHSISDAEKIIEQIEYYEGILFATLKKINDSVFVRYKKEIQVYYARMKFGNALDAGKREVIVKTYQEMKKLDNVSMKDRMLYFKATHEKVKQWIDKVRGK